VVRQTNPYATARPTGAVFSTSGPTCEEASTQGGSPQPSGVAVSHTQPQVQTGLVTGMTVQANMGQTEKRTEETKTGDEFETPPTTPPRTPQVSSSLAPPLRLATPASCPPVRKVLPGVNAPALQSGQAGQALSSQGAAAAGTDAGNVPAASGVSITRKASTHSLGAEPLSRYKSDTSLSKKDGKDGKECDIM